MAFLQYQLLFDGRVVMEVEGERRDRRINEGDRLEEKKAIPHPCLGDAPLHNGKSCCYIIVCLERKRLYIHVLKDEPVLLLSFIVLN